MFDPTRQIINIPLVGPLLSHINTHVVPLIAPRPLVTVILYLFCLRIF